MSLCRFILKTDDDAFVNVPVFVQQLRLLCESPDCRRERLYMGKQCRRGQVILSPGHKWNNGIYYNHTGGVLSYPSSLMMPARLQVRCCSCISLPCMHALILQMD
jgi:hypothetical protein